MKALRLSGMQAIRCPTCRLRARDFDDDPIVRMVAPRRRSRSRTSSRAPRIDEVPAPVPVTQDSLFGGASQLEAILTQGGGPLPQLVDTRMGSLDQDLTAQASSPPSHALADATGPLLDRVRAARTAEDLRNIIHPENLFRGLETADATYDTVAAWLSEIRADTRDPVEIGVDTSFSIQKLLPAPFRVAIQVVSLAEGWPPEALFLAICSNVGWLENPSTCSGAWSLQTLPTTR